MQLMEAWDAQQPTLNGVGGVLPALKCLLFMGQTRSGGHAGDLR